MLSLMASPTILVRKYTLERAQRNNDDYGGDAGREGGSKQAPQIAYTTVSVL